jgi:hypothetical protein
MNKTYTFKQAMDHLGMKSTKAFRDLMKKYPDTFVVVGQKGKKIYFDQTTVDKLADSRDRLHDFLK